MEHDLILPDTKPILGVIVSQVHLLSPTQREGDRVVVVVVGGGHVLPVERPRLQEEIAVSLCGGRERTQCSPSLLLPERLITEAGRGESW